MSAFVKGVHTPEALTRQIGMVSEVPDVLIAGSIGRSGIYNRVFEDPFVEYVSRDQSPLTKYGGYAGDIDVIGGLSETDIERLKPFDMDTLAFGNEQMTVIRRGGEWILKSSLHDYEEVIDGAALRPVKSEVVYGAECFVPPAQTQLVLLGLSGVDREQDILARETLEEAIKSGNIDELDPDLLAPFHALADLNRNSKFARMREIYRASFPDAFRVRVSPMTQSIKNFVGTRL